MDPTEIAESTEVEVAVAEPSSIEFVHPSEPPSIEDKGEYIVDNAPQLVDDDPTRFGFAEWLATKGTTIVYLQ